MSVISGINPPSLEKNPTGTDDVKPTQKDSSINSKLNILDEIIFIRIKIKRVTIEYINFFIYYLLNYNLYLDIRYSKVVIQYKQCLYTRLKCTDIKAFIFCIL